jgi:two-component system OmpR family sensor kinase
VTSIRRTLLASLIAAVVLAACTGAAGVYVRAREETADLLDYQMRQMALALANEPTGTFSIIEAPPYDFDFAIQVTSEDGVQLYYQRSRVPLPSAATEGYSNVVMSQHIWRVYTHRQRGIVVNVAQPVLVRDELAAKAAVRTLTPFLVLLPVLALIVWVAVTRGLKPLQAIANAVRTRSPALLQPLPAQRLPQELAPIVAALNELLGRLDRTLKAQRAFIADAAHELRTPLTALALQLQLAERAKDDAERSAAFATLKQGLARTTHLVEQLLTLAREEPGAVERGREPVDLGTLAADVVATHAALAQERQIDLGLAQRDANAVVAGEPEALRTLLSNLVINAVRYTPRGSRVDVSVLRTPDAAMLEVLDNGPGIPPEERARVFDRFYRRGQAEVPGSGLGLSIVRSVAERHGATVALDSGPGGKGLRVRVSFPLSS